MGRHESLKSSRVYQSPIFEVYEEEIILPGGRFVRVSRIAHGRTVSVVPVKANASVVMIRQYRPAIGGYLLEIPAGRVHDESESAEDCVQREMAEEIGYRARTVVKLFGGYLVPGYGNEYMEYYLGVDLYRAPLPPDEDEVIETLEMPMEAVVQMVLQSKITDTKTALGILLAEAYLKRHGMVP